MCNQLSIDSCCHSNNGGCSDTKGLASRINYIPSERVLVTLRSILLYYNDEKYSRIAGSKQIRVVKLTD